MYNPFIHWTAEINCQRPLSNILYDGCGSLVRVDEIESGLGSGVQFHTGE